MKRLDLINLLEEACGDRCNPEYNPCAYKEAALELRDMKPVATVVAEISKVRSEIYPALPLGTKLYALGDEK